MQVTDEYVKGRKVAIRLNSLLPSARPLNCIIITKSEEVRRPSGFQSVAAWHASQCLGSGACMHDVVHPPPLDPPDAARLGDCPYQGQVRHHPGDAYARPGAGAPLHGQNLHRDVTLLAVQFASVGPHQPRVRVQGLWQALPQELLDAVWLHVRWIVVFCLHADIKRAHRHCACALQLTFCCMRVPCPCPDKYCHSNITSSLARRRSCDGEGTSGLVRRATVALMAPLPDQRKPRIRAGGTLRGMTSTFAAQSGSRSLSRHQMYILPMHVCLMLVSRSGTRARRMVFWLPRTHCENALSSRLAANRMPTLNTRNLKALRCSSVSGRPHQPQLARHSFRVATLRLRPLAHHNEDPGVRQCRCNMHCPSNQPLLPVSVAQTPHPSLVFSSAY